MAVERSGVVTMGGKPVTLLGPALRVGDRAPDFAGVAPGFTPWRFYEQTAGKVRLISVVPSLDTSVCNLQTRRFEQECTRLPEHVALVTVSMDLPPAQERWQKEADAHRAQLVSDHLDGSFGLTYGTLMKETRLEARAVFVVDSDERVLYAEYVPEVTQHPNYEAALAALRAAR